MSELVRQEIMTAAELVVVKVGTRVLTRADGTLDQERVANIGEQVARQWEAGRRVVLVSSGAVGAALGRLDLQERPTALSKLQAAAAIGQSLLIESYNRALEPHRLHAAQVLLTAEDLQDRSRYLNFRNTLFALFELGAVPIINENDTVSVDELQLSVGDNDRLAALVTNLIRAPLLVLLSDIDGLYDGDPDDPATKVMSVVTDLSDAQEQHVHDAARAGKRLSKGCMATKLQAVRIATSAGENVVIANGHRDDVLDEILAGADLGTLFIAEGPAVDSRKRWIGWSANPSGRLTLDVGACTAIEDEGRSLLAVGVTAVDGAFAKGDVVALCDQSGREFARGLINYSAEEMRIIAGHAKDRIAELLGHR
ncbi:MAG: glutamate 5-kinase, partial [Bythopirellula sp.]